MSKIKIIDFRWLYVSTIILLLVSLIEIKLFGIMQIFIFTILMTISIFGLYDYLKDNLSKPKLNRDTLH